MRGFVIVHNFLNKSSNHFSFRNINYLTKKKPVNPRAHSRKYFIRGTAAICGWDWNVNALGATRASYIVSRFT